MIPGSGPLRLFAALLTLAGGATLATSATPDPALQALRSRDAYVSPQTLGPATAAGEARLAEAAESLAGSGHPVKLAIVAGPSGAPSMLTYARRLKRTLAYQGTIVVTAPSRPVVAVGPRAPAAITRDLRAGRVGQIADPIQRVVEAAGRAVGAPIDDGAGSGTLGVTVLLALAVIGGAWAAAWGLRREARRASAALAGERARVRVELDALRARARTLASRPDPSPAARGALDRAVAAYSEALVQIERARRPEEVRRAVPPLDRGLAALAEAARALGEPLEDGGLYEGLCAIDPGHGAATSMAVSADGDDALPACEQCAHDAAAGRPPSRRVVPIGGRHVPFDEAPPAREILSG